MGKLLHGHVNTLCLKEFTHGSITLDTIIFYIVKYSEKFRIGIVHIISKDVDLPVLVHGGKLYARNEIRESVSMFGSGGFLHI